MKRAQVQMGETIAVLIVFFFLIVIGVTFYVKISASNLEVEKDELTQLDAVNTMKRVLALAELKCTQGEVVRESCIDIEKLKVARSHMDSSPFLYFDLFGFTTITVEEIYPNQGPPAGVSDPTIYDRPLDAGEFSSKLPTRIPVSLLNPITDELSFGIVTIWTYAK